MHTEHLQAVHTYLTEVNKGLDKYKALFDSATHENKPYDYLLYEWNSMFTVMLEALTDFQKRCRQLNDNKEDTSLVLLGPEWTMFGHPKQITLCYWSAHWLNPILNALRSIKSYLMDNLSGEAPLSLFRNHIPAIVSAKNSVDAYFRYMDMAAKNIELNQ